MNKIKFQKGITLIALIITVVLLIILAAVTIGSVKETDVIGYAQNAAEEYEEKQNEEQGKVTEYKEQIKDVLGASHVTGRVTVDVIATKNSTINGNVPSSTNPVIPSGFKAINITTPGQESSWDAEDGPQVDKGLVIEDDDENQFVWVPVPELDKFAILQEGSTENYRGVLYNWNTDTSGNTLYEWSETTSRTFIEPSNLEGTQTWDDETTINGTTIQGGTTLKIDSQDMFDLYNGGTYSETMYQDSFNKMVKSVEKHGGFYVGRYETSLNGEKVQSKEGQWPMNHRSWYEIYKYSKSYTRSGIVSEMIWGCQWDAMMKFIGSKATETGNVGHDFTDGVTKFYLTGGDTCSGKVEDMYSGTVEYNDIANNIYDLEGNLAEWTQEAKNPKLRIFRGGDCAIKKAPSARSYDAMSVPIYSVGGQSSRLALYVK